MNLQQFRETLEGEAQKKVAQLEPENKRLRNENADLLTLLKERDKEIARLEERIKNLQNQNPNLIDWGNRNRQEEENRGIRLDLNNPNSLVTLAMLGQMVGKH